MAHAHQHTFPLKRAILNDIMRICGKRIFDDGLPVGESGLAPAQVGQLLLSSVADRRGELNTWYLQ